MIKLPKTDFKIAYTPLQGGEDLITPSVTVDPGRAIMTHNYELDMQGRYRLIDGYEVFDGQPKPSDASYWILHFDAGTAAIAVTDIVDGAGGASGEVLVVEVESGSWATSDAAGYLVLFNVTGTYVDDEVLSVSAVPKAIANGTALGRDAETDVLDSTYLLAAIAATRDDIEAVPGSGNILGVWQYNGVKYAIRNSVAGTEAVMYKSSTAGWVICDLGERLGFNTGTAAFVEGETITKGGVTAVIRRVVVQVGSWSTSDAEGFFIISGRAGGHFSAGACTGSIAGAASATGVETANAFAVPSGRFEFVNYNFGGHAGTIRMYGCDGKNKAFEWDGTYYTPIETGMTVDTPVHIIAHRSHLFLMFPGGSIQHSSIGQPYLWSAVTGAAELGVGDEGTGFLSMINVLAVFARNSTHLLYGTSSADWELIPHSDESGAIQWTIQKIGAGIYLDDRGLTSLSATDQYGDFAASIISKFIHPYLRTKMGEVQGSIRVKDKNQYRLFFSDMRAVTLTMDGNKVIGFTRQMYDKLPVCVCSSENTSGEEEIFFGSTDGYVYQMDSGNSFNGNPIEGVIKFHFNHLKSPSTKKRIRKIMLELDAPIDTYINANVEFDYGEAGNPGEYFAVDSPGGIWDIAEWDAFVWDGKTIASAPIKIDGTATNFSLTLYHSGVFELQENEVTPRAGLVSAGPHTIQGYTVQYDMRGVQR
jgi:hypothetical protein